MGSYTTLLVVGGWVVGWCTDKLTQAVLGSDLDVVLICRITPDLRWAGHCLSRLSGPDSRDKQCQGDT